MSGNEPSAEERFSAFISYSHSDEEIAKWLHRAIESYRFPKAVIGTETPHGPLPRKLPHVFRDRDELAASGDLGDDLRNALLASRFQIVVCSPAAANSFWVNEEIRLYKQAHGEGRTLALIASGEPYSGKDDECFPPALRFKLDAEGNISNTPAEPIAADIRSGKDGRRLAKLKVLAGITGLPLDALVRRDLARRQRRMFAYMAASTAVAVVTLGLAIYANEQRRIAVEERDLAESSLEFLTGTFEVANPATENPRTITALTVLDRASNRAMSEFAGRPRVAATLLRTTGDIYYNLGLYEESTRDLNRALELEPDDGSGRARTLLRLAELAKQRGDLEELESLVSRANRAHREAGTNDGVVEATLYSQRANIAYLKADYDDAADLYASSVATFKELAGDNTLPIGRALMDQAYALVQAGQYDEAMPLYDEAYARYSRAYGEFDVRTAKALHNQAFASLSAGDVESAGPRMEKALGVYRKVLEADHPGLAVAYLLLGRIYTARKEYSEAITAFGKAREIFTDVYSADNPAVADVNFYLAETLGLDRQFDKALGLTREVEQVYTASYGPMDPDQAELLLLRSRINTQRGERGIAHEQCQQALQMQAQLDMGSETLADTKANCNAIARDGRLAASR
ncbi:tetratricopeptide repeat protein [Qipengyuania vesicularis]|uniref:tetratricopeptide repeat protein n=1 Tax=Qipengyuania vesicularis TaxID=2867232 RepID=UPI001C876270|nr:tetratricopeptide repeat protein [Qipengyuania vesicularis]MBX7526033.1 toll/interleukin-1 receptor domain-containing protein [Qipengyuania vesicularis]